MHMKTISNLKYIYIYIIGKEKTFTPYIILQYIIYSSIMLLVKKVNR